MTEISGATNNRLDCIVNNAGIAHKQVFADLSDEQWNLTMNVDLRGMMYVVRAARPMLVNSDQASVVCYPQSRARPLAGVTTCPTSRPSQE